jgi:hypothetical protein
LAALHFAAQEPELGVESTIPDDTTGKERSLANFALVAM